MNHDKKHNPIICGLAVTFFTAVIFTFVFIVPCLLICKLLILWQPSLGSQCQINQITDTEPFVLWVVSIIFSMILGLITGLECNDENRKPKQLELPFKQL